CCGGQSGRGGSWRGGFGLFPPAPSAAKSLGTTSWWRRNRKTSTTT
ncbi:MAG: hypothetical protein AVDCRST_MAG14-1054, partial [uncultured Rubrobacteraceae bacterium]